ncbi:hypothetical protein BD414DRAFT_489453 [Trametes punicea]|nr:hypothetical protein BD414DRAFT_489453 [Trametes punicea]
MLIHPVTLANLLIMMQAVPTSLCNIEAAHQVYLNPTSGRKGMSAVHNLSHCVNCFLLLRCMGYSLCNGLQRVPRACCLTHCLPRSRVHEG